jgi:hypothetical protein
VAAGLPQAAGCSSCSKQKFRATVNGIGLQLLFAVEDYNEAVGSTPQSTLTVLLFMMQAQAGQEQHVAV